VCLVIEKNEGEGTWRKVVWGNIYLLEFFFKKSKLFSDIWQYNRK
jgi:hypothetical protein